MAAGLVLTLAILTEVIGTVALRYSEGFTRAVPSVVMVVAYALSFYFLAIVLRQLPLGFVYAIWAGAGTALVALIGMVALGEAVSVLKIVGLALVIAGVVSLNLAGAH
ncbi:MAG: multidrug efflux SMR transporter [Thermoleophilaceae bacterium]|nr:multidrug efflux SMR transporter [Thermoleophilaceae bacterium]